MEGLQRPPVSRLVETYLEAHLRCFLAECEAKNVDVHQVFGNSLTDPNAEFSFTVRDTATGVRR